MVLKKIRDVNKNCLVPQIPYSKHHRLSTVLTKFLKNIQAPAKAQLKKSRYTFFNKNERLSAEAVGCFKYFADLSHCYEVCSCIVFLKSNKLLRLNVLEMFFVPQILQFARTLSLDFLKNSSLWKQHIEYRHQQKIPHQHSTTIKNAHTQTATLNHNENTHIRAF